MNEPTIEILPEGEPFTLCPQPDITALEAVHIAILLNLCASGRWSGWAQYIAEHKLERHFK